MVSSYADRFINPKKIKPFTKTYTPRRHLPSTDSNLLYAIRNDNDRWRTTGFTQDRPGVKSGSGREGERMVLSRRPEGPEDPKTKDKNVTKSISPNLPLSYPSYRGTPKGVGGLIWPTPLWGLLPPEPGTVVLPILRHLFLLSRVFPSTWKIRRSK